MKSFIIILMATAASCSLPAQKKAAPNRLETTSETIKYPIVDTGQSECFDNHTVISPPSPGQAFYGQDTQFSGNKPSYSDNDDGTVNDHVTGLMWQKSYETLTYDGALAKVKNFRLANYTDWRIPTIKEAYSLMLFSGVDVSGPDLFSSPKNATPFIDTTYFDFRYGSNGHRSIDVQLLSSTFYAGTTMNGQKTVFGVNVADGRIKGYPLTMPAEQQGRGNGNRPASPPSGRPERLDNLPGQGERPPMLGNPPSENGKGQGGAKYFTVRLVRGNPDYGKNNFQDNNNGTISDLATGLMWQQTDSQKAMDWEDALAYAATKNKENYLGHNDWRVPNAKELQSIIDYSRSPQTTKSAAIHPLFGATEIKDETGKTDYPWYWTSTTHKGERIGDAAVYLCFGESLGYMQNMVTGEKTLMDVHGAGSQRSDPKTGNASEFPSGRGPQGDVIRVNNFVRLVRDIR
jgi:hypothetical protein